MILYVESNFILELAFRQEEHEDCEALLQLAEAKEIELVLPAFCVGEPFETIVRRDRKRREAHRKLMEELRELGRSAHFTAVAASLSPLVNVLLEAGDQEKQQLDAVLQRLLQSAALINVDSDTLTNALSAQRAYGLEAQDSMIYASIHSRLDSATSPQCFVTRNAKDFLVTQIADEFLKHGCKLLGSYQNGLRYVRSMIVKP